MPYTPAADAASRIALALEPQCHSSAPRFCVYACAQRGAAMILVMASIIYALPCMIEGCPSWCVCSGRGGTSARNIHRLGSWRGCGQDATGFLEEKHRPWSRKEARIPDQTLIVLLSVFGYPTFGRGRDGGGRRGSIGQEADDESSRA
ncbi:hypothetical protein COCCADRAFT_32038 [Bipolaris zeicola 26-R-13]|uniref:Uncharacterized protein n=1 Tax=Cochliobolus carbonum (strain 26-R-13) TaxID=930089 RepID=W6YU88_COCC2|nr:uncharacterized protein COCCADRAFT_32038 [Bipolaris zeicola 26-R-13]EUC38994.1 hypothetical protein COCCADRAFT_32038 [Bipolaris zeicola 26-R-13]